MSWVLLALSAPVLWAISTHLDKYLVERFFKNASVAVLLVFTAVIGLALLPFILIYQPGIAAPPPQSLILVVLSGILYMGAMFFYLQALQGAEASVIAPFYQAAPLFGYALGYFVLGEVLSATQMVGGFLVVLGAASASLQRGNRGPRIRLRLVVLMLACALSLALSSLVFKFFAMRIEFWTTVFWTYVGEAAFGLGILLVARYRRELLAMLRANPAPVLGINAANELINLGGSLAARYALLLAPLSLVQAISSTTSLFVVVFGIVLTLAFPKLGREDLSPGNLAHKSISALLVVIGVNLISR